MREVLLPSKLGVIEHRFVTKVDTRQTHRSLLIQKTHATLGHVRSFMTL